MNQDNLSCFLCCTSFSQKELHRTTVTYNLDVVFLLRNLLHVPSIHLESQLKESGHNPEDWISLCDQCTQLIKNARELDKELQKIQMQLRSIQKQVLEKIRACGEQGTTVDKQEDKETCRKNSTLFGERTKSFVRNCK